MLGLIGLFAILLRWDCCFGKLGPLFVLFLCLRLSLVVYELVWLPSNVVKVNYFIAWFLILHGG